MSRKWKAALAPALAGIPLRTGFAGEARFGLINDMRWGESKLPRMIDQMGALVLPKGARLPEEWPLPELKVPRGRKSPRGATSADLPPTRAPSSRCRPARSAKAKRGRVAHYGAFARALTRDGASVWVLGGPSETALAKQIAEAAAAACAISPATICATRSSRWPPPTSPSPTIPA